MTLRPPAMPAALVAMQAALCPLRTLHALGAERDCPGMLVAADAGVSARWPDLASRIESELSARADIEPCVRVDLRRESDAVIIVSVTLPDGRAASRRVSESADVVPTLQGLLLMPIPEPEPIPASAATPPPAAAAPQPIAIGTAPRRAERDALSDSPRNEAATRSMGVELSLVTGGRLGDGQLGVGLGALSFLEWNGWLVGFQGRADSYRAIAGSDAETALELAILTGKRFDINSVALDLNAGPGVAMMGLSSSQREIHYESSMTTTETPRATPALVPPPEPRASLVPRLLLGARLGFRARSVFRGFVGLDGEIGPALQSSEPSSARLPEYSVGVSLGATLGTP